MRGIVPDEIRARRKRGTQSPLATWLRAPELPAAVADALSAERLAATGVFAPAPVRELLARHRAGIGEHHRELLAVASVQIWHDLFVTRRTVAERPTFAGDATTG